MRRMQTLSLDELQRTAVKEAVKNGLLVLTGGPGTGKTTTINAMIHFFESEGLNIYLAAPYRTCGKENDGGDWLRGADITQTAGGQWQSRGGTDRRIWKK